MNKEKVSNLVGTYATPIAVILGGLILLLFPDTATALLTKIFGWAAILVGVALAFYAITGKQGTSAGFQAPIYVFAGIWLIKRPMSLAVAFGKLLGIGLLLSAISGYRRSSAGRGIYVAEGILGVILLVAPLTATRTVCTILGLVLLVVGVITLISAKGRGRLDSGDDSIIDV